MRGSIGNLISQEIEYFRKLEAVHRKISQKSEGKLTDVPSTSGGSSHFSRTTMKKKQASGGKFLPRICSMVEVTDASSKIVGKKSLHATQSHLLFQGFCILICNNFLTLLLLGFLYMLIISWPGGWYSVPLSGFRTLFLHH